MSMSKKDFVALADQIRGGNIISPGFYSPEVIRSLADWCGVQNPRFNRARWLAYIAGECGPGGGKVKGGKQ